jgi:hypothetical protein
LRSFHYRREYDALPRMMLTSRETATLLRTTVDPRDGSRPELTGSDLAEIEAAATTMTTRLAGAEPDGAVDPDEEQLERWRRHHGELTRDLCTAGVPVRPDATDDYLSARARWDVGLSRLARQLMYDWPDELRPAPGD